MRLFFFDTETTGLPKDWKAPASDTDNWPRMVQFAFLTFIGGGNETPDGEFIPANAGTDIIRPDGFTIPEEVSRIHGVTQERAEQFGVPLKHLLPRIHDEIMAADLIVGHNISFDRKILGAEFHRAGLTDALEGKTTDCTMMGSTKYCNIMSGGRVKWPKLQELHNKLFGADFESAHDAGADIAATALCYFELLKLGVMNQPAHAIEKHLVNKAAKDAREAVKAAAKLP